VPKGKEVDKEAVKRLKELKLPDNLIIGVEGEGFIGVQKLKCVPKVFSTGSVGYNFTGKVNIELSQCQVSGNVIVIGSKP